MPVTTLQRAVSRVRSPFFEPSSDLNDPATQIYLCLDTLLNREQLKVGPECNPELRGTPYRHSPLLGHARRLFMVHLPVSSDDKVYGRVFPKHSVQSSVRGAAVSAQCLAGSISDHKVSSAWTGSSSKYKVSPTSMPYNSG